MLFVLTLAAPGRNLTLAAFFSRESAAAALNFFIDFPLDASTWLENTSLSQDHKCYLSTWELEQKIRVTLERWQVPTRSKVAVLGIDPGLSGAYAALDEDGEIIELDDIPTETVKTGRKTKSGKDGKKDRYLVNDLRDIITRLRPRVVVYEQQHAMRGQGVTSMFSTGYGFGMLEGMLSGLGQPSRVITAQSWTKTMLAGQAGDGKERAVLVARRMYPKAERLVKSNGRADALLIAFFGLKLSGGDAP